MEYLLFMERFQEGLMKRMIWRAAQKLILGLTIATISAGCTLSGATEAPPLGTSVGPGSVTQQSLPTTQAPILASPTSLLPVGSPTPTVLIDPFATLTAAPQTTPGAGITPGSPAGATITPSMGLFTLTPTPLLPGGATSTPGATQVASGSGTGSCPSTYTVQSGDNLFRIALRFNLSVAQLAAANGIANANFIIVGTVLKIPGCGTNPAPSGGGATAVPGTSGGIKPQPGDTVATNGDILHTVKAGENLYRIALAYGLSWQTVATYNGITSPDQLVVGQVIHIPTK
jgi:LysM repeat protein